ncbi:MAG: hypothetical protein AB1347_01050 [Acidobacteriota bacterium]
MKVRCASCGADFSPERDRPFLECPFCASTLYLDRARTFPRLVLPPVLSASRAVLELRNAWRSGELPELPVLETKGLLLPFWSVRGRESQGAVPAFSPRPSCLEEFRLPGAGARVGEAAPPGFEAVPCSQGASTAWMGAGEGTSFTLFMVPFFRIRYGSPRRTYTAWVDGVLGRTLFEETPPPLSAHISRRFWAAMSLLFALFALESFFLPGPAAAAAVPLTGVFLFPLFRRMVQGASR